MNTAGILYRLLVAQQSDACCLQAKRAALGADVDINKYVAGGIAAFDLTSRTLKWHTHLDLSTDETQFRAHIYSSPTLVDIDGDGSVEIIVGTSMVRCSLRLLAAAHEDCVWTELKPLCWSVAALLRVELQQQQRLIQELFMS